MTIITHAEYRAKLARSESLCEQFEFAYQQRYYVECLELDDCYFVSTYDLQNQSLMCASEMIDHIIKNKTKAIEIAQFNTLREALEHAQKKQLNALTRA